MSTSAAPARAPSSSRFYAAAWRWHFYAGLFVVPFLTILAVTGLAFPLAGAALLAVVLLDWLLIPRVPALKNVLS